MQGSPDVLDNRSIRKGDFRRLQIQATKPRRSVVPLFVPLMFRKRYHSSRNFFAGRGRGTTNGDIEVAGGTGAPQPRSMDGAAGKAGQPGWSAGQDVDELAASPAAELHHAVGRGEQGVVAAPALSLIHI